MVRKLPAGCGAVHRRTGDRSPVAASPRQRGQPVRGPASVTWIAVGPALALLAAVLFAFGTVLQQKGTMSVSSSDADPRFLLQILHRPVWLAGAVLQAAGWVVQAMALDRAALLVVQSLTALSLVIALPLGMWLTNQRIGRRELAGAILTIVGIVIFLSGGQPQGGISHPSSATWWAACLITFALVGLLFGIGWRFTGAAKALTFGAAAGLGYGLQAAVTKTFVTEIGGGALGLVTSWSTYVLIVSAFTGLYLQQSALKTGVLAPAMASSNSVTLFSSVLLGIAVYGESLSKSGTVHSGSAALGLVVAIVGIAFLAGSDDPSKETPGATHPSPGGLTAPIDS
jgi:drug/metabolite transporter (DMT)-like permease